MQQADAIHTTSRRNFILSGAAIAAVGTVAILPEISEASPLPALSEIDWDSVSPEFWAAHDELIDLEQEVEIAKRAMESWERRNPFPGIVLYDDEDYEQRRREKDAWYERQANARRQSGINRKKVAFNKAIDRYDAAEVAIARLPAKTMRDCVIKAGHALYPRNGNIALSLARDLIQLDTTT